MIEDSGLKLEIWESVLKNITGKLELCRMEREAAQAAANQEGKSSAGDKYETGRAMSQRQVAELKSQEMFWQQMLDSCLGWKKKAPSAQVVEGSLVYWNGQWLLVGPGLGLCTSTSGKRFIAVSASAPVGKALMGKKAGDKIDFQGKETLLEIIN